MATPETDVQTVLINLRGDVEALKGDRFRQDMINWKVLGLLRDNAESHIDDILSLLSDWADEPDMKPEDIRDRIRGYLSNLHDDLHRDWTQQARDNLRDWM